MKAVRHLLRSGVAIALAMSQSAIAQSNTAPPLPPLPSPAAVRLDAATENLLPLGPDEIKMLRQKIDDARRAAASTPSPVPSTSSETADLSPGSLPVAIRIAPNHGATINFVDVAGQPWPIENVSSFDERGVKVELPVKGGSFLTVNAVSEYGTRNIAVFLKDLGRPVSLFIAGGQRVTDFLKEVRIPRRGPNSANLTESLGGERMPSFDEALSSLLDGIPPPTAILLKTTSPAIRAWKLSDSQMVVRSQHTVMLPAWTTRLVASDGTAVYSMIPTPIIMLSINGSMEKVEVEGF